MYKYIKPILWNCQKHSFNSSTSVVIWLVLWIFVYALWCLQKTKLASTTSQYVHTVLGIYYNPNLWYHVWSPMCIINLFHLKRYLHPLNILLRTYKLKVPWVGSDMVSFLILRYLFSAWKDLSNFTILCACLNTGTCGYCWSWDILIIKHILVGFRASRLILPKNCPNRLSVCKQITELKGQLMYTYYRENITMTS